MSENGSHTRRAGHQSFGPLPSGFRSYRNYDLPTLIVKVLNPHLDVTLHKARYHSKYTLNAGTYLGQSFSVIPESESSQFDNV